MSLITQAFIVERYGLRLNAEQLADVLGPATVRTYVDFGIRFADYRDVASAIDRVIGFGRPEPAPKAAVFDLDRKSVLARQTPCWADLAAIREIYAERGRAIETTGIPHEVDHIVPLRGKLVSGFHVENNLRVLTTVDNRQKRNRFEVI